MREHEVYVDGVLYVPWVDPDRSSFDIKTFFDSVRGSLFSGSLNQGQVEGCELILRTCEEAFLDPLEKQSAYVLATVYHETNRSMQPIAEYGGARQWYAPWYGRGHVQLTLEENYRRQQAKLGAMPLAQQEGIPWRVHDNRELALHPRTSALICVHGMADGDFTGLRLGDFIRREFVDFFHARRIVNGLDRAEEIARYANRFLAALEAAG